MGNAAIPSFVGVLAQGDGIVAFLQEIAAFRAVFVVVEVGIGSHLLFREFEGDGFLAAGFDFDFVEGDEVLSRLFDMKFLIKGGIWGGVIDLDSFFAIDGAGVLDLDGDLDGIAAFIDGGDALFKGRIA